LTTCADSSFLVSKYIADSHSQEADRRMQLRPIIWLTPFNRTEFAHAVHQYVFRKAIAAKEAQLVWAQFEDDCDNGVWVLLDLPMRTWDRSIDLARQYGPTLGIRTLDSLHVACALELGANRFWTFDERQAKLAEAVGLDTTG
jgi:predicted nucleic acid-binding protein